MSLLLCKTGTDIPIPSSGTDPLGAGRRMKFPRLWEGTVIPGKSRKAAGQRCRSYHPSLAPLTWACPSPGRRRKPYQALCTPSLVLFLYWVYFKAMVHQPSNQAKIHLDIVEEDRGQEQIVWGIPPGMSKIYTWFLHDLHRYPECLVPADH